MGLGIDYALLAVDKFQITTPPDINILKGIYQHEGIILHYFPFNGRLNAIYLRTPDGIELFTIKNNLPQNQIKYLLAYGYACRLLNPPINPATYIKVIKDHPDNEIDTEAEDFAALLLIPPTVLPIAKGDIPVSKICSLTNVPESLALKRMEIAKKYSL